MRYILIIVLPLTLLTSGRSIPAVQYLSGSLPVDKTCVGYKTTMTLFLTTDLDVVGKNCSVTTRATAMDNLKIIIPVDKFDSGDTDRDEQVARILGGAGKRPLVFETSRPGLAQLSGSRFVSKGALTVNNQRLKLDITFVKEGRDIYSFQAASSMGQLGITIPKVGWGLIATPSDELVLFGRVLASQFMPTMGGLGLVEANNIL